MTDTVEKTQLPTDAPEAAAEKPKKAKAPKPPKAPKDVKNGITRPKSGTATARVWEIADTISKKNGEPAARKEVMETYVGEGGNTATCATQYGRWRRYHGLANVNGGPGRPKKQKTEEAKTDADTKVEKG